MFLRDQLKKVFGRLVVYCFRIGDKAVLYFQLGFVSVVPPFVKQNGGQVSVQIRAIPSGATIIVNKRCTVNPAVVVSTDNRLNILLCKLLFKFRFAVCV